MTTYVSQMTLARKLQIAPATLAKRLRDHAVTPDGIVLLGSKSPAWIFQVERLPELRKTLSTNHPIIATSIPSIS